MAKIKVKIGVIGYLPFEFNRKLIKNWRSDVFEIVGDIDEYHFNSDSDMIAWGYSDKRLSKELPSNFDGDFFVGITYVPIEDNYYARRIGSNRVVLSYFEMYQILKDNNIPMENLLLRILYAYCLVFLRYKKSVPAQIDYTGFTHDDTRGCLFDMNGNKTDVVFSLDSPKICDDCSVRIRKDMVPDNCIKLIKKEILNIKKKRFYKIADFVQKKPLVSLMISAVFGISLSLIATIIYENFIR